MALQANALTTVAKMKEMLGITFVDDDTVLEDMINEASDQIESFVEQSLKDSVARVEIYDGNNTGRIMLRGVPLASVTSVEHADGDYNAPTWTALSAAQDYLVDSYLGIINVAFMVSGIQNYRVTYRGGYTTVPSDITKACKIIVADAYGRRNSSGASNESVGGASVAWELGMPQKAKEILDKYKKYLF